MTYYGDVQKKRQTDTICCVRPLIRIKTKRIIINTLLAVETNHLMIYKVVPLKEKSYGFKGICLRQLTIRKRTSFNDSHFEKGIITVSGGALSQSQAEIGMHALVWGNFRLRKPKRLYSERNKRPRKLITAGKTPTKPFVCLF